MPCRPIRSNLPGGAVAWLALLLAACASPAPTPPAESNPGAVAERELACTLPSNCVNSLGTGALAPLRFNGTPVQGLALLQATLATFPEARVVKNEPLALEVIFTTPIGFRDQVDFRIDAGGGRIDFRSRSIFGRYDFGKNHSRMAELSARFARQVSP